MTYVFGVTWKLSIDVILPKLFPAFDVSKTPIIIALLQRYISFFFTCNNSIQYYYILQNLIGQIETRSFEQRVLWIFLLQLVQACSAIVKVIKCLLCIFMCLFFNFSLHTLFLLLTDFG